MGIVKNVEDAAKWTYENTPILGKGFIPGVKFPGIGGAIASLFDDPEPLPEKLDEPYPEEYYSGCDVGIFIGDRWVDDIITIQYTLTNNKSPIYGYMSEEFDAVAKGTKVVQGQFAIAFTDVDYLNRILENYKKTREITYETIDKRTKEKEIKEKGRVEQLSTRRFDSTPDTYGYKSSFFGDYINSDGFSIIVTFGDTTGYWRGGTYEILDNIHITSRSLVCEPTGEPIAEIYSFFAKKINKTPIRFVSQYDIKATSQVMAKGMEEYMFKSDIRLPKIVSPKLFNYTGGAGPRLRKVTGIDDSSGN